MDNFFINWIRRREAPTPTQTLHTKETPSNQDEGEKGGSFEERIITARTPNRALTVSAVYRAMELRAKTIGLMPVQYQQKDRQKGNYLPWMVGLGKRMNYILQEEPNPIMNGPSLWQEVTINRMMQGNGFVYIERDVFGDPVHLWLAECAGYNYMDDTYTVTYYTNYGIISKVGVPSHDVMHFPNTFRYYNGFWGIPTLQYAAETLSLIKTEKAQALETAAKGGRVKGFIHEAPQKVVEGTMNAGLFSKSAGKNYAKEISQEVYRQDINFLRGTAFTSVSMTSQDMQLLEHMNLGLDDIARFWGVPRPLLMLDTNSHYTSYSDATMEFIGRTIGPDRADMEKEMSRKLIGRDFYGERRIHICEKPLLAMDPERQAKVDLLNLQTGARTINEIRAEHEMPAVANGDEPIASANLLTLKALLEKGANVGGRPTTNTDGNESK